MDNEAETVNMNLWLNSSLCNALVATKRCMLLKPLEYLQLSAK